MERDFICIATIEANLCHANTYGDKFRHSMGYCDCTQWIVRVPTPRLTGAKINYTVMLPTRTLGNIAHPIRG